MDIRLELLKSEDEEQFIKDNLYIPHNHIRINVLINFFNAQEIK